MMYFFLLLQFGELDPVPISSPTQFAWRKYYVNKSRADYSTHWGYKSERFFVASLYKVKR